MTTLPPEDVAILADSQIANAMKRHAGGLAYFLDRTIEQALADRAGLTVYRNAEGRLAAYYTQPTNRGLCGCGVTGVHKHLGKRLCCGRPACCSKGGSK